MLSQMKTPRVSGIGQRNNTVEAVRIAQALLAGKREREARERAARPAAAPMDPSARHLIYAGKPTPKQARRMERKADQWRRRGLDVSGPAAWDPEQCICATMNNPPCAHCETAVYEA